MALNIGQILGLNPCHEITCIGLAKSKRRRCYQKKAEARRREATFLLEQITSATQVASLEKLTSLLLCKASHQHQDDKLVAEWTEKITAAQAGTGPSTSADHRPEGAARPAAEPARVRLVNELGNDHHSLLTCGLCQDTITGGRHRRCRRCRNWVDESCWLERVKNLREWERIDPDLDETPTCPHW